MKNLQYARVGKVFKKPGLLSAFNNSDSSDFTEVVSNTEFNPIISTIMSNNL